MIGVKVAFGAVAAVMGSAASFTGILATAVPAISEGTPITVTVGLICAGFGFVAISTWKIARAWSDMEKKQQLMDERVTFLMAEHDRRRIHEEERRQPHGR